MPLNVGNQNNFSLLSYLGSKFTICRDVINYFPKHKIYAELFGGAANVLLAKKPATFELYNDVYNDVVNLFYVIRDNDLCRQLFKAIKRTPLAEVEYLKAYEPTPAEDYVERARKLLIRSNCSFHPSGVFSKNTFRFAPQKNLTKGSNIHKFSKLPEKLVELHKRFKKVVITHRPAIDLLKSKHFNRPDCLIYCDPPYVNDISKTSEKYLNNYTDSDHLELLDVATNSNSMICVSGYKNALYDDFLYGKGWRRIDFKMPYSFVATANKAEIMKDKQITECLWLNRNLWRSYDAEYFERLNRKKYSLF